MSCCKVKVKHYFTISSLTEKACINKAFSCLRRLKDFKSFEMHANPFNQFHQALAKRSVYVKFIQIDHSSTKKRRNIFPFQKISSINLEIDFIPASGFYLSSYLEKKCDM